ncbi:MAG: hypothetical protein E7615_07710 [Ruminococcaceae bacterium]|nr:hypothetical protein [Oscillospiraceae bacterium]
MKRRIIMPKVKIITDSCADLTAEQLERYDIDYAKMTTVYHGNESPARLTWSEEEVHELYGIMRTLGGFGTVRNQNLR